MRMGIVKVIVICIRKFLELLASMVYTAEYWNIKETYFQKPLIPIKNKLLLESATSLADKIRNRKVSSEEVVKTFIERINHVNQDLNAIIETRFDIAIKEAQEVDEYLRENSDTAEELKTKKPFYGVPITIKENLKMKGFHLTTGLWVLRHNISDEDCVNVSIMKDAGAIILGTTNVPEMVMWWETSNKVYGRTSNPYDLRRMPGGSSGGEGAIVSAAGSAFGIGSDVAGSIRMPAHFNGVFGHKTTPGIVSTAGIEPYTCKQYEEYRSCGPLCRFAQDLRPILKLLTSPNAHLLDFDEKIEMKKIKIYYMDSDGGFLTTPVTNEVKEALHKTIDYFKVTYNITCEQVNLPELKSSLQIFLAKMSDDPDIPSTNEQLTKGKASVWLEWEMLRMMFAKSLYTFPSILTGIVKKYWRTKKGSSGYKNTMNQFNSLKESFKELLTENAVFFYPPSSTTALFHQETHYKPLNFLYTSIFNILGLPATVCPVGLSSSGLPICVQVVGGMYRDNLCISVAEEIEKAFGGWVCPSDIKL